jgi:hypothetical protein
MPRKQVNVRLSDEVLAMLNELLVLLRDQYANPDMNVSDVVRVALVELHKRLLPSSPAKKRRKA